MSWAVRRVAAQCRRSRPRRTPCGVWPSRARSDRRRRRSLAVDALERLRDGHDGDRGAVRGGGGRHRRDDRAADERPGAVMDQDDAIASGRAHAGRGRRTRLRRTPGGVHHPRRPRRAAGSQRAAATSARRSARGHDHDPGDDGGCGDRGERPGRGAATTDRPRRACPGRPSASTGRRHDDGVRRRPAPRRSSRRRAQSRRGWAKIIRPATVCRTRVTDTSRSRSMWRAPPSTTIIVPSSRKPTP